MILHHIFQIALGCGTFLDIVLITLGFSSAMRFQNPLGYPISLMIALTIAAIKLQILYDPSAQKLQSERHQSEILQSEEFRDQKRRERHRAEKPRRVAIGLTCFFFLLELYVIAVAIKQLYVTNDKVTIQVLDFYYSSGIEVIVGSVIVFLYCFVSPIFLPKLIGQPKNS